MASATLAEQATTAHFTVPGTMETFSRSSPAFADQDRRHGRSGLRPIRTQLAELVRAGVDVFRLNMAHGDADVQQQHVDNIRD